jgi:hypothetical protein
LQNGQCRPHHTITEEDPSSRTFTMTTTTARTASESSPWNWGFGDAGKPYLDECKSLG